MNRHRIIALWYLLLVSVIWGVAGPIIKVTLADFPPLIFLTYRFGLNSLVTLFLWRKTLRLPKRNNRKALILLYSILVVPLTLGLLFYGFNYTSAIEGSVISTVGPIFAALAGFWFLREHVTKRELLGLLIALGGTLLLLFEPLLHGQSLAVTGSVLGNSLILLSVIAETAGLILAKVTLRETVSPFVLTSISFLVGFIVIAPLAIATHGLPIVISTILHAPLQAHLGVWFMAFISGLLAYTLKNKALKTIEIGESSVFNYLYPIWAAPLALYWLGEQITIPFIIAAIIITVGVILAEFKKSRKK
jgi:drug/metabolite transporter (DMT)-like permease